MATAVEAVDFEEERITRSTFKAHRWRRAG